MLELTRAIRGDGVEQGCSVEVERLIHLALMLKWVQPNVTEVLTGLIEPMAGFPRPWRLDGAPRTAAEGSPEWEGRK